MIIATCILIDEKGNTIGAEFNVDGKIEKYSTEQLKVINQNVDNAIIDKNGFVRSKRGELPKVILKTSPNIIDSKEMHQARVLLSKDNMTLFHGNKNCNMVPCYGTGKKTNDYGQGFYTSPDIELAKEWAWGTYTQGNKAYVHGYEIDTQGLNILNLTEMDSLHWVAELFANRTINLEEKEALKDTLNAFVKKYKYDTSKCDIIIGYRADDSYFRYAMDFLESSIYRETLDNALRYGNLGMQVFIKSEEAFKRLKKIGMEEVPRVYEQKYKKREHLAIQEYNTVRINQVSRKKETIHHFI